MTFELGTQCEPNVNKNISHIPLACIGARVGFGTVCVRSMIVCVESPRLFGY